jgi:hypothetical protein
MVLPVQLQTAANQPQPVGASSRYAADATRTFGAQRGLGRALDAKDPQLAHEAAALMTSQLFFAPLLAEMRKLPFGKEFGYGGRMEEAFGEQLDQHLADTVARSDRGLTAQLAERLGTSHKCPPVPPSPSWQTQMQARQAAERSTN